MGTTLTALTSDNGVAVQTVVAIEGYPYLLTDGETGPVVTAWAATDWSQAIGGLDVNLRHDQQLHPWEPYNTTKSKATIAVMDVSGTNADTFGLAVFKREGHTETRLTTDLEPDDTTINVQSASSFAATGYVYVGCETIKYTGTTGTTFTGLTRGYWSPFSMEGGARFPRRHRVSPTVENVPPDAISSTVVSSAPIDWRGRWVGVWIHRSLGGVLDLKAQAHLAFAGRIASVRDSEDGRTVIEIDDVRSVIGDAVVFREQLKAKIVPMAELTAGMRFWAGANRDVGGVLTTSEADPLIVVPSGATPPYEINAGRYSANDIATAINDWLAAAKAAGDLIFTMEFTPFGEDPNGNVRSSLYYADTNTNAGPRVARVITSAASIGAFYGWADEMIWSGIVQTYTGMAYSSREPRQITLAAPDTTLEIEEVTGTYVDQSALLDGSVALADGIVRIGSSILACYAPTISNGTGTIRVIAAPLNRTAGLPEAEEGWNHPVSADGRVPIEQVLFLTGSYTTIMLALLASTGTGDNWTAYDLLPEQLSAGIPYELMGTSLEAELIAAPNSAGSMTATLDKPMRFVDVVNVSTILRLSQFVWRQGRIALRGHPTPTSSATMTITADQRSTPIGTSDPMTAVTVESDELMRNIIRIEYGADAFGADYRHSTTIINAGSAGNFGTRPLNLKARNATRGTGIAGEEVQALLPTFAAGLTFLSIPSITIKVPIDHGLFETATPGEVCLFSDGFARDPATGLRGLSGKPALITASRFDWGGYGQPPSGEIDVQIFQRLSLAPYSPCAQVDDTAANAGYNAGTKVLTCYAHEHSEATATLKDAEQFAIGDKVRVVQIDPDTAAAPTTWTDTVAGQSGNTITLTTGLAGWNTSLKYRVISDDYSTAVTAQRTDAYQADDADGLIQNLRAPYSLAWFVQATNATLAAGTEYAAKPPTVAYGDGKPLDTGHARDLARGINALVSHRTPQQPQYVSSSTFGGGGTWQLVHLEMVYIGIGGSTMDRTHKLYVGPTVLKAGAASADIRVTLAQRKPRTADPASPDRDDVTRIGPYSEHTFTTTSVTWETMSAVGLDTSVLSSAHNHMPGVGYLYVEIANHASFAGFGTKYVGPLEAP